ncbi:hypothetical protein KY363_00355 [Candidatus Woesearchaeota archaeon]|nr:hypothetical protein [Candidatus Woesearchaeota archaeon]
MGKPVEKSRFDKELDVYKAGSTIDGKKKRRDDEQAARHAMHTAAISYLGKKHGKTEDGAPKKFDIDSHDDAHDFVLEMAKAYVKQKFKGMDKKGLDHILKNEHLLIDEFDHALGPAGTSYHQMVLHFAEQGDNVVNHDEYKQMLESTASTAAHGRYVHAQKYLANATDKRDKIEGIVNKMLAEQGHAKEVSKAINQGNLVRHLGTGYSKGLSDDYVAGKNLYATHFKNKPKKK